MLLRRYDKRLTHGAKHTPEYKAYQAAKGRCQNKSDKDFTRYGARGIKFNFVSFQQFIKDIGPRPTPLHSLDRINNEGHYQPGNVRWATRLQQRVNSRLHKRPA